VSFLDRTPGMTSREAVDILDLHELVQHSLVHGPVDLERYAVIRQVDSEQVASWERSARRLVQRLRALGYRVAAEGDGETLTLDFARDRFLVAEVERWIDRANSQLSHQTAPGEATEAACGPPSEAVLLDWDRGLSVELLHERYGLDHHKLRALLRSSHRAPRPQRRPRVEERRDPELVALALAEPKGRGYYARVARALGCSRWTARRLIERVRRSVLDDSPRIGKIVRHEL
jgi:hypothetical protein